MNVALIIYLADISEYLKNSSMVSGGVLFVILFIMRCSYSLDPKCRSELSSTAHKTLTASLLLALAVFFGGVLYPTESAIYKMAGVTKQSNGTITVDGQISR